MTPRQSIATKCLDLTNEIIQKLSMSRELSQAVTKLEEAAHWIAADEIAMMRGNPDPAITLLSEIIRLAFGTEKKKTADDAAKAAP